MWKQQKLISRWQQKIINFHIYLEGPVCKECLVRLGRVSRSASWLGRFWSHIQNKFYVQAIGWQTILSYVQHVQDSQKSFDPSFLIFPSQTIFAPHFLVTLSLLFTLQPHTLRFCAVYHKLHQHFAQNYVFSYLLKWFWFPPEI